MVIFRFKIRGGPVPLGYRCLDKKLEIVPEEAETVRTIFSLYLELQRIMRDSRRQEKCSLTYRFLNRQRQPQTKQGHAARPADERFLTDV
jgi:DNA invertase Pin-like site-specific DNA recombinase